jgi:hypothetical protein
MNLADYESYIKCQEKVSQLYQVKLLLIRHHLWVFSGDINSSNYVCSCSSKTSKKYLNIDLSVLNYLFAFLIGKVHN